MRVVRRVNDIWLDPSRVRPIVTWPELWSEWCTKRRRRRFYRQLTRLRKAVFDRRFFPAPVVVLHSQTEGRAYAVVRG